MPVRDLDARENVRRIFVELVLDGLARVRADRCCAQSCPAKTVQTGRDQELCSTAFAMRIDSLGMLATL
jgi:hypothetical protein